MRHLRPPDFRVDAWRQTGYFKITTDESCDVGWYSVFVHERSGCPGIRMDFANGSDPLIGWEECLAYNGREWKCRYIAWRENNVWHCLRVEQYYPARMTLKRNAGFRLWVDMVFILATRREQHIEFKVPF